MIVEKNNKSTIKGRRKIPLFVLNCGMMQVLK
jgi:hypothetical protein